IRDGTGDEQRAGPLARLGHVEQRRPQIAVSFNERMPRILRHDEFEVFTLSSGSFARDLAKNIFIEQFLQLGEGIDAVIEAIEQKQKSKTESEADQSAGSQFARELWPVRDGIRRFFHDADAFRAYLLVHVERLHGGQEFVVKSLVPLLIGFEPLILG